MAVMCTKEERRGSEQQSNSVREANECACNVSLEQHVVTCDRRVVVAVGSVCCGRAVLS